VLSVNGQLPPTPIAFSPDGMKIASDSSQGNAVTIWDAVTGSQLASLVGHLRPVCSLAFSPDGEWLVSGSNDSSIKLWSASRGKLIRTFLGQKGAITSLAFSPDGHLLASGSADKTVVILAPTTGTRIETLVGQSEAIEAVSFSPNGLTLVSASDDGTLRAWEVSTGKEVWNSLSKMGPMSSAALSQDGRWVASAGADTMIRVWDRNSGTQFKTLRGDKSWIDGLEIAPNGDYLVSSESDGTLQTWEIPSWKKKLEIAERKGFGRVALSPNGNLLASSRGGDIKVYSSKTGTDMRDLRTDLGGAVTFSHNGRWLASGLKIWDVSTWDLVRTFRAHTKRTGPDTSIGFLIGGLAFSPDDRFLASAADDGTIILWDLETGQSIRTLSGHTAQVRDVAFSPDGRFLVSAGWDKSVRVWEASTGRSISNLVGHSNWVNSARFDSTGHWIISAGSDGTVRIWDAREGELAATLISLRDGDDWLVTTPDGLFDGSEPAWGAVLWRFSSSLFNVAPVELFFNDFYYPGLLADVLADKRPRAPRNIAKVDRRQPRVDLTLAEADTNTPEPANQRTRMIRVTVAQAPIDSDHSLGSGVRDVRLFRNGSLVKVWHGDVLKGRIDTTLEAAVSLVAGENRLSAYAFNRDNIKSSVATLLIKHDENVSRKGVVHILAIGVNHYEDSDFDLKFATADAEEFARELSTQQVRTSQFSSVDETVLLDKQATKSNILAALGRLAGRTSGILSPTVPRNIARIKRALPEDSVFIYFAGHGVASGARFFFIPYDMGYRGKRKELQEADAGNIFSHSISDLELEEAVEGLDSGHLILVVDACNAGQALEAEEKRRGPMNVSGLAQLAYEKGMYVLTAAQGYQAALEAARLGHGLLTYALIDEGLKTRAADTTGDGVLTVQEWIDYAVRRVPELQLEAIREARNNGRNLSMIDDDQKITEPEKKALQRPRAFYRRDSVLQPFTVARFK